MKTITRSLVFGCSMLALAGCGAEEIASPGTGGNVIINNPTPTPTPPPTPTGGTVTAANGCPTIADAQGLTDEGTIQGPTGTYRVCAMPARFNTSSTLPYIAGLLYRMPGRVDVGTVTVHVEQSREQARLLVLGDTRAELAVLVDEVFDFVRVSARALRSLDGTPVGAADWILGMTPDGTIVLDGRALLTDPRLFAEPGDSRDHEGTRAT